MQCNIYMKQKVDIKRVFCSIGVRYWEDAYVNGEEDNEDGDNIPLKNGDYWDIIIDIETGVIKDWDKTKNASVHYKSCDDNVIKVFDDYPSEVLFYDGYVPEFLCPEENGYGDYVIFDVDNSGKIKGWKPELVAEFVEVTSKEQLSDD